jgi:hypothetical protein
MLSEVHNRLEGRRLASHHSGVRCLCRGQEAKAEVPNLSSRPRREQERSLKSKILVEGHAQRRRGHKRAEKAGVAWLKLREKGET